MNGWIVLIQIVIFVWIIGVLLVYYSRVRRARITWHNFLKTAKPIRQLGASELEAVHTAFKRTKLVSNDVYLLEGSASVQGISSSRGNDLHLVVGGVALKPFPQWALYVESSNRVEVVRAHRGSKAVPVSFNGLSLAEAYARKKKGKGVDYALIQVKEGETPQRVADTMDADVLMAKERLVSKRQETSQNAVLRKTLPSNNAGTVLLLCVGMAIALGTSFLPGLWQCTGIVGGGLIVYAVFRLLREWRAPLPGSPETIRTLEGPLGLRKVVSGTDKDPIVKTETLVGGTAVIYPPEWKAVLVDDPQDKHRVSIDEHNNVVRHDALSLYDQYSRYPVPKWGRYLAMLVGGVPLAVAAFLWTGPVQPALQTAAARLAGTSRELASTSPQALVAAKPAVGDWLKVNGSGQCLGNSDARNIGILQSLLRGHATRCDRLGWVGKTESKDDVLQALMQTKWDLPKNIRQLAEIGTAMLSSLPAQNWRSRALDSLQGKSTGRLHQLMERIRSVKRSVDLNVLVTAVAATCLDESQNCSNLEFDSQNLAGDDYKYLSWDEMVVHAKAGNLPSRVHLDDFDARYLSKNIVAALSKAVHLQQLTLLQEWRQRQRPAVYFASLDENGVSSSPSQDRRLLMLVREAPKYSVLVPVVQMLHTSFSLQGEVRRVTHQGTYPVVWIQPGVTPQSLFALVTAPLVLLVSLLLVAVGILGLIATLPARKRMKAAQAQYIRDRLLL